MIGMKIGMQQTGDDVTERLLAVEKEVRRLRRVTRAALELLERLMTLVTIPDEEPVDDPAALRMELECQMDNLHSEFGCIQYPHPFIMRGPGEFEDDELTDALPSDSFKHC